MMSVQSRGCVFLMGWRKVQVIIYFAHVDKHCHYHHHHHNHANHYVSLECSNIADTSTLLWILKILVATGHHANHVLTQK